jgi:predicted O-methyltransferase YrrM
MKDFNKTPADIWHKLSYFKIYQKPEEFVPFLELIRERSQASTGNFAAVEIGSYAGGTAVLLAQYCDIVIGIDLSDPLVGCDNVHYIIGNSTDTKTKRDLQELLISMLRLKTTELMAGPIDVLFIDGDHSVEGCLRDYEMYSPLVKPGGMIAFHDIISSDHHRGVGCNVDKVWFLVKKEAEEKGWETREIIGGEDFWGGIGIIFKQ